jgi:hypothetical protein
MANPTKSPMFDKAGAGAIVALQIPRWSGALQTSRGLSQGTLQHTPSGQKPD